MKREEKRKLKAKEGNAMVEFQKRYKQNRRSKTPKLHRLSNRRSHLPTNNEKCM